MSSTGTGEGRTGSRRRQSRANNYSISNINRKRRLIIHGLGNSYVCQTVMPENTNISRKTSVTEDRFGA